MDNINDEEVLLCFGEYFDGENATTSLSEQASDCGGTKEKRKDKPTKASKKYIKRKMAIRLHSLNRLTHFISIPINVIKLQENYKFFKDYVLEKFGNDRGVNEDLFQNPEKLHLTLGVMMLSNEGQEKLAIDTLEKCKNVIIDPLVQKEPIIARVHGVHCMNNDPSKVKVLYGKIFVDDTLQSLANEVTQFFIDADLMNREGRSNLLHLTFMNTQFARRRFIKRAKSVDESNLPKLEKTFDARNILQNFENHEFGEVEIKTLHLSEFRRSENGYYKPLSTINF